jgi:hypothetical protein
VQDKNALIATTICRRSHLYDLSLIIGHFLTSAAQPMIGRIRSLQSNLPSYYPGAGVG